MLDVLRRNLTWVIRIGIVAAVVVVALVIGTSTGSDSPDSTDSQSGTEPSDSPTSTAPAKVDPDTFCAQFRIFADAQSQYVAYPDDPARQETLVTEATKVLDLGEPLGLSPAGLVALRELVDSTLEQEGDPAEVQTEGASDPAELQIYLETTCPA